MGSGKGKARRTQTHQPPTIDNTSQEVKFSEEKWDEYVENIGLLNIEEDSVGLNQYYLGKENNLPYTLDQYKKIQGEVFADAVTSGALTLPPPYEFEDFEFEVTLDTQGYGVHTTIVLKSHPEFIGDLGYVSQKLMLGVDLALPRLEAIADEINEILSQKTEAESS